MIDRHEHEKTEIKKAWRSFTDERTADWQELERTAGRRKLFSLKASKAPEQDNPAQTHEPGQEIQQPGQPRKPRHIDFGGIIRGKVRPVRRPVIEQNNEREQDRGRDRDD